MEVVRFSGRVVMQGSKLSSIASSRDRLLFWRSSADANSLEIRIVIANSSTRPLKIAANSDLILVTGGARVLVEPIPSRDRRSLSVENACET
jgi:hypothetical protein